MNVMRAFVLSAFLLLGAGCAAPTSSLGPIRLDGLVAPVGTGEISFALRAADGRHLAAADLEIVHEKRLHLIVVSDDLRTYRHLHPEESGGVWRVDADLPGGVAYRIYADFKPAAGAPLVVSEAVGRRLGAADLPEPGLDDRATDGDLTVAHEGIGDAMRFTLRQDGRPPADLRPYLGALGHVLVFKHGAPDVYVHAHADDVAPPPDGVLGFVAPLPGAGRYTTFAQFDVGGELRLVSFTFDTTGAPSGAHVGH